MLAPEHIFQEAARLLSEEDLSHALGIARRQLAECRTAEFVPLLDLKERVLERELRGRRDREVA